MEVNDFCSYFHDDSFSKPPKEIMKYAKSITHYTSAHLIMHIIFYNLWGFKLFIPEFNFN